MRDHDNRGRLALVSGTAETRQIRRFALLHDALKGYVLFRHARCDPGDGAWPVKHRKANIIATFMRSHGYGRLRLQLCRRKNKWGANVSACDVDDVARYRRGRRTRACAWTCENDKSRKITFNRDAIQGAVNARERARFGNHCW